MTQSPLIGTHGLEYNTPEWRELRNQKLAEWIGDENALLFLRQFGDITELFDDLIDKDKPVSDADVINVLFIVLTELPINPFFNAYKGQLIPIIITGINAWLDANKLEGGSENDKVFAYVLRDWYVELLSFVICALRGREYMRSVSMEIRSFFTHHETLAQYLER